MPMTTNDHSGHERLARRRRYRRLVLGLIVGGAVFGVLLRELQYPLVGEAVYWLGVIAGVLVWAGTSVSLVDERDIALERRASHVTLNVIAVVLAVGASAARVVTWVTDYTVPAVVWGALYGYIALFVIATVVYVALRYR